jgi:hypothetical protein
VIALSLDKFEDTERARERWVRVVVDPDSKGGAKGVRLVGETLVACDLHGRKWLDAELRQVPIYPATRNGQARIELLLRRPKQLPGAWGGENAVVTASVVQRDAKMDVPKPKSQTVHFAAGADTTQMTLTLSPGYFWIYLVYQGREAGKDGAGPRSSEVLDDAQVAVALEVIPDSRVGDHRAHQVTTGWVLPTPVLVSGSLLAVLLAGEWARRAFFSHCPLCATRLAYRETRCTNCRTRVRCANCGRLLRGVLLFCRSCGWSTRVTDAE